MHTNQIARTCLPAAEPVAAGRTVVERVAPRAGARPIGGRSLAIPLRRRRADRSGAPSGARGQSLVEFSIVLAPLLLVLLGVLQFGLIFNSYVTVSNAVREAAREGSIYRYSQAVCNGGGGGGGNGGGNQSCRDANDAARMARMLTVFRSSLGMLSTAAPQFTDADLTVTYEIPSGAVDADTRAGDRLVLRATYHQDLLVPFIAAFLPQETISGRTTTPIRAQVTMVVN